MNERSKLLVSIADTIKDYRKGEIVQPTPDHVGRWIGQFDNTVQIPLLHELDHVLKKTYFSKSSVSQFFARLIENEKLVGDKPRDFWQNATILDIQKRGHSQTEIRELFGQALKRKYGPTVLPDDDDLQNYVQSETKFPFEPRPPGGRLRNNIFSSENGRQLLEKELLLAGVRIRSFCANPSQSMRPLGFGSFNIGFGSTIVTYRNCPNNCPLALWWGDPNASPYHPFNHWC